YLGVADAVLVCGEDEARVTSAAARIAALTAAPRIRVRTKIDLVTDSAESRAHIVANGDHSVQTSARTGDGIAELADAVAAVLAELRPPDEGADALLTRERHRRAVTRARDAVAAGAAAWRGGVIPSPVVTTHLREAALALE